MPIKGGVVCVCLSGEEVVFAYQNGGGGLCISKGRR